jgi:hypothetical protein
VLFEEKIFLFFSVFIRAQASVSPLRVSISIQTFPLKSVVIDCVEFFSIFITGKTSAESGKYSKLYFSLNIITGVGDSLGANLAFWDMCEYL